PAALLAFTLPNPFVRKPALPGPLLWGVAGLIYRRGGRAGAYVGCLR
ncbi:monofunctional biosynthetic peptidoglycan transglycosylase, partial [Mesorhizobium sp. M0767]